MLPPAVARQRGTRETADTPRPCSMSARFSTVMPAVSPSASTSRPSPIVICVPSILDDRTASCTVNGANCYGRRGACVSLSGPHQTQRALPLTGEAQGGAPRCTGKLTFSPPGEDVSPPRSRHRAATCWTRTRHERNGRPLLDTISSVWCHAERAILLADVVGPLDHRAGR